VVNLRFEYNTLTGILYAALTISLWSLSAYFSAHLQRVSPLLLVGISFSIAGLIGIRHVRSWKVPWRVVGIGVGGLFGYQVLYFLAFQHAPAVQVNLINYLWPLLVVLLSPVYLRGYVLRWNHILGGLAGLIGAWVVVTGGGLRFNFNSAPGYGYAAVAALIWASYSLLVRRFQPLPDSLVSGFCALAGLLALGLFLCSRPELPEALALTRQEWLFTVLMGIGPHGIAFVTWNLALKHGDPRVIGSFSYLIPLLSTLILVITGTGKLTAASAWGMILIVMGILIGSGTLFGGLRTVLNRLVS
jgi:drug/metabolite transporter (DMT)-like permease